MKAFNSELKVEGGKVFCGDEFLFEVAEEQAKAIAHAVNRYSAHIESIKSLTDTIHAINNGFSKAGSECDAKSITFKHWNGNLYPVVSEKVIGGTVKAISDDGYIVVSSTTTTRERINSGDYESGNQYQDITRTTVKCLNADQNFYTYGGYTRDFKVIEVSK